jgi:hypothetical protein
MISDSAQNLYCATEEEILCHSNLLERAKGEVKRRRVLAKRRCE